jgi:predicted metal-dependent TIM-barrel fold hydrolase
MTVYPISKLTPERVSNIVREHGSERMIVNGSADWGISDPLSLVKVVRFMQQSGHDAGAIENLVFRNAMRFYGQSQKWRPDFTIVPENPLESPR